jgi:hypothetical protein
MRKTLLASAACAILMSLPASAATVIDAAGDFLPSYTGPLLADLDVTSFSVLYDPEAMNFLLGAEFAGPITPGTPGLYVIGVNTGTGVIDPFDSIGQGNVIFNQAIVIQKTGATNLGTATISGNSLSAIVPLSALPSTGFSPLNYGFNIWPRTAPPPSANDVISDFSPENATVSAIPEPSTLAMLVLGFGLIGGALRFAKRRQALEVSYA